MPMLERKHQYGAMIIMNEYFRPMENDFEFDIEKVDPKFILWRLLFWIFLLVFLFFMLEHEKKINLENSQKQQTKNETLNTNTND